VYNGTMNSEVKTKFCVALMPSGRYGLLQHEARRVNGEMLTSRRISLVADDA